MLKLIESLRHCTASEGDCRSCPHYTHDSGCLDRLHTEAADLLESQQKRIAELEEKNRWIPVTERLPKEGQRVIIRYNTINPRVEKYRVCDVFFDFVDGKPVWDFLPYEVPHWMPLPEPPKEV